MVIWIGNILLSFFFAFVLAGSKISKVKQNSYLLRIMFVQLLFLYVFKDNTIFNDIWAYIYGFEYSISHSWTDISSTRNQPAGLNFSIGWWLYTKMISTIIKYPHSLIVVTGAIIVHSYYTLIRKYSQLPWISIFMFIATTFYSNLFLMKQSLALAISLYSLPFLLERKFLKFLLIIGLAYGVHYTAVVFLLLYFTFPKKLGKNYVLKYLLVGLIVYYGFNFIIVYIMNYYQSYQVYLSDFRGANITPALISLSVFVFISIIYHPYKDISDSDKLFYLMAILLLTIDIARVGSSGTFGRLNLYFFPAIIIGLPNAISKIQESSLRYYSIVFIILLYFIVMINQMNYGFELSI